MNKKVLSVSIAAILIAGIAVFFTIKNRKSVPVSANVEPAISQTAEAVADEPAAAAASFDVVRVDDTGVLVAAGRGEPADSINLMDGDDLLSRIIVNDDGEWVYIPADPLDPGLHELWLQTSVCKTKDCAETVLLSVAERAAPADTMAVKLSPDAENVTVLQVKEEEIVETDIDIQSVNYAKGLLTVSGKVLSTGKINVYINNDFVGNMFADKAGDWKVKATRKMKKGVKYMIRADKTDASGRVSGRVEVPFEIEEGADIDKTKRIRVVKGDCLWKIAKYLYGDGQAYVTIYKANKKQIKNPDLIYPNQVFVVPAKAAK